MTEQEAIKINGWTFEETVKTAENLMESERNMFKWDVLRHLRDFAELFCEELRQYLAIGTLEELNSLIAQSEEEFNMLIEYISIGTVEECRAAVEKQKAKKPIRNDKCTCPSCGTHNEVFKKRRNTVTHDIVYCWHCGQAVEIDRLE